MSNLPPMRPMTDVQRRNHIAPATRRRRLDGVAAVAWLLLMLLLGCALGASLLGIALVIGRMTS